jgi:hypothetical protein
MGAGKVLALLLVVVAGCDVMNIDVYDCPAPDKGHKNAKGQPDPCHHSDLTAVDAGIPGDAGDTCNGVCLVGAPDEWFGPELVWIGDEADAPPCPAIASAEGFTGRRPPAGQPCATTCTCGPPSGSCALPSTVTASSAPCPGTAPGAAHTSFDPPASWAGGCTAANAILPGQLCGGVPCVQSVTIAPLTVNESDCAPIETPNVTPPPWGTFARACLRKTIELGCVVSGEVCAVAPPGPEFKECVSQTGNPAFLKCPPGYPEKNVFYDEFVDNRYCTPCTCGATEKSSCVGSLGLFSDALCGVPLVGPTISIDATSATCVDINPTGSALKSKSASEPTYKAGICPVTGGEQGQIDANITRVVCCQGAP